VDRVVVGGSDQDLGGKVEHHVRLHPVHNLGDNRRVGDVTDGGLHELIAAHQVVHGRGGRGLQRQSEHLGPELVQPQRKPGALKPGVACHQDPFSCPKVGLRRCLPIHANTVPVPEPTFGAPGSVARSAGGTES